MFCEFDPAAVYEGNTLQIYSFDWTSIANSTTSVFKQLTVCVATILLCLWERRLQKISHWFYRPLSVMLANCCLFTHPADTNIWVNLFALRLGWRHIRSFRRALPKATSPWRVSATVVSEPALRDRGTQTTVLSMCLLLLILTETSWINTKNI